MPALTPTDPISARSTWAIEYMRAAYGIAQHLHGLPAIKALSDLVLDSLVAETGVDRGVLLIFKPATLPADGVGTPDDWMVYTRRKVECCEAGRLLMDEAAYLTLSRVTRSGEGINETLPGGVGVLCVPLVVHGPVLGVMYLEKSPPETLVSPEMFEWASLLAAQVALEVDHELRLIDAHQEKMKFVSAVTHELRLPMTSIKGYTDLILKGMVGPVSDMQNEFLGIIRSNVDRMSGLVADLADLSYIETGRMKFKTERVALAGLIEEVLVEFQPLAEEKQQTLVLEVPDNLPDVNADVARLKQVLGSLLNNAIMYSPEKAGIVVMAHLRHGVVAVEVRDPGIGISEKDQQQLFTRFFRSDASEVREQKGWGLALCVAKGLVNFMGGEIGVESQLAKGSTFWLTLPVSEDPST